MDFFKSFLRSFFTRTVSGLLPHKEDERDFKFSWLGASQGYLPAHDVLDLKTATVKNQGIFNTCVWNSAAAAKEIDEGKALSPKFLVALAKYRGLVSGTGYGYLRDAQKLLVSSGIAEEALVPDIKSDWSSYSSPSVLTGEKMSNAALHKSSRYFLVDDRNLWFKALDEGHAIHTGLDWYSGYNQGGGFSSPWILIPRKGAFVGGHAVLCKGYDVPRQLFKFQNSYGSDWGDDGCFYVRFKDMSELFSYGYVTVDVDNATIIAAYEGKDVKSDASPAIYRVEDGKKRPFPNEAVYFKHGGKFNPRTFVVISDAILNLMPTGEMMS